MDLAVSAGADEAEVYFLDKGLTTVRLTGSQISETKGLHAQGMSIRTVKDNSIGMATTNNLSFEGLEKAVKNALAISKVRECSRHWKGLPRPEKLRHVSDVFDKTVAEMGIDETVSLATRCPKRSKEFKSAYR